MVFNRYLLLSQMNKKEMLKIPELPIYNTERYTNFSPISPDDIRPGHIYTNDSLFLYVSHLSFNKTASYSVWDKEGEYVGTEMYSSQNIYAIVTYLNNNNFRPLDYDFEVVDPYNTDRRLLLTPNGIKKVNNVDESFIRGKISKLIEKSVRQVLKENINGDFDTNDDEEEEELSPFEEYEQGYPNDDFNVSDMTPEQLATWCKNVGDFLYVFEGLRGMSIMAANTDNIVSDIVNDLYNCQRIEPSHEVDYLFYNREREFINDYVCIFKVIGTKDGDYYIVYQEDKHGEGNIDLSENRNYRQKRSKRIKAVDKLVNESVKRIMKESFQEQWEEEIQIFLDGLKNGEALIDDGYVAVEWGHNESDPRFIYYKEGEDRLTDDHFSIQHSRRLYWEEISSIRDLCKRIYGVDIYIPDDEYYNELEDWEK